MLETSVLTIVYIVMGVSLVLMIVLPVLPGQLIIWFAALAYGLITGWQNLGWGVFIALTLLMLIAWAVDFAAGWVGANKGGASKKAILLGFVVGIVGFLFFNVIGALVGTVGGIAGYEYWQHKDWKLASKAGVGYLGGLLASLIVRFLIAVLMVAIFAVKTLG